MQANTKFVHEKPQQPFSEALVDVTPDAQRSKKGRTDDRDPGILRDLWQKQVPYLYDFLAMNAQSYVTTAMAWGAGSAHIEGDLLQRLMTGTRSADSSQDYHLTMMSVLLPWKDGSAGRPSVQVTHRMPHDGPVELIACSPHRQSLVATQSHTGDVLLFDFSKWGSLHAGVAGATTCCPDLRLTTLVDQTSLKLPCTSALCWHPITATHLVGSLPGGLVRLWDVEAHSSVADFSGHTQSDVTGISFCKENTFLFASSGMDGVLKLWDTLSSNFAEEVAQAHPGGATCVAFEHCSGHTVATGGVDGLAILRDARKLACRLSKLAWGQGEGASVTSLAWAPFNGMHVLATNQSDGRVHLWDTRACSTRSDAAAPTKLVFCHGGHEGCSAKGGLAWSFEAPWLIASSAACSEVQTAPGKAGEIHFWQPSEAFRPGKAQTNS